VRSRAIVSTRRGKEISRNNTKVGYKRYRDLKGEERKENGKKENGISLKESWGFLGMENLDIRHHHLQKKKKKKKDRGENGVLTTSCSRAVKGKKTPYENWWN